jgi:hypothetical protein
MANKVQCSVRAMEVSLSLSLSISAAAGACTAHNYG